MNIIQIVFEMGIIPRQMKQKTLVVIPKGDGNKYLSVGLVYTVWNICSRFFNQHISSKTYCHPYLHGLRTSRWTNTAILMVKLLMDIWYIEGKTIYQVFLDLRKAYDSVDRDILLEILTKYGVGKVITLLISNFW